MGFLKNNAFMCLIQLLQHRRFNQAKVNLLFQHCHKNGITPHGLAAARTTWESASQLSILDALKQSTLYDDAVAQQFAHLWKSLVVPTMDQVASGAAIAWRNPQLMVQVRRVFWTLGETLRAQPGDLYRDLSIALCVYALLPLTGNVSSAFCPEAQLPSTTITEELGDRYMWMKGETGMSMVSAYAVMTGVFLTDRIVYPDGIGIVPKLLDVACAACVSDCQPFWLATGGHACYCLPVYAACVTSKVAHIMSGSSKCASWK